MRIRAWTVLWIPEHDGALWWDESEEKSRQKVEYMRNKCYHYRFDLSPLRWEVERSGEEKKSRRSWKKICTKKKVIGLLRLKAASWLDSIRSLSAASISHSISSVSSRVSVCCMECVVFDLSSSTTDSKEKKRRQQSLELLGAIKHVERQRCRRRGESRRWRRRERSTARFNMWNIILSQRKEGNNKAEEIRRRREKKLRFELEKKKESEKKQKKRRNGTLEHNRQFSYQENEKRRREEIFYPSSISIKIKNRWIFLSSAVVEVEIFSRLVGKQRREFENLDTAPANKSRLSRVLECSSRVQLKTLGKLISLYVHSMFTLDIFPSSQPWTKMNSVGAFYYSCRTKTQRNLIRNYLFFQLFNHIESSSKGLLTLIDSYISSCDY